MRWRSDSLPEEFPDWLDALVLNIRDLHDEILTYSKGSSGEHTERLIATCARPFQSAFGERLFKTDMERAAVLFHGIIASHVFVDGNKRTAALVVVVFLMAQERIARASDLQLRMLGELAIETAATQMKVNEVADWIRRIFDLT